MKKYIIIASVFAALLSVAACQQEGVRDNVPVYPGEVWKLA